MRAKFDKYWSDYSLILSCAAILDPRYKINLLRFCYKKLCANESAAEEQVNKAVTKLYELFEAYRAQNSNPSITSPRNLVGHSHHDDLFDDYADYVTTVAPQTQKSQLDLYLEQATSNNQQETQKSIWTYWSFGRPHL